eukprot:CAMPEP_0119532182 /NCGR_PEP_ID=MMETSP1344-20130328/45753_1 /TAXON_ID=236787 /ORGANISM="Florenciella parvula, Strain CCMP2471" /LENGTH=273 /DNA_ID=CAMNT_0007572627 /DNA_START=158 /DNA_END=974 /DNA_ORIENTATION=-
MAYVKGADPGVIQATVVGGSEPSYQPVVAQPVISQPVMAQPQPVAQVAQPASTMMSITVPAGCGPGSILQIQGPNGPLNITVPPNVGPGATLQVDTGGAPAPAPAPAPVMAAPANTMSVTVPAGVGPGSVLQVAGPNGPINITVPPGIAPGTVLQVQVPPATHLNTQVNGAGRERALRKRALLRYRIDFGLNLLGSGLLLPPRYETGVGPGGQPGPPPHNRLLLAGAPVTRHPTPGTRASLRNQETRCGGADGRGGRCFCGTPSEVRMHAPPP